MKKNLSFIVAMLIALAMGVGTQAIGQCPSSSMVITDQNPHTGVIIPSTNVARCYGYPPNLTGALHPIGDFVIEIDVPTTAPEIALHLYDVQPGNVLVFGGLNFGCDTIYDTMYTITPLNGEWHFYTKSTQRGYVAILSASRVDTVTIQVSAVDPIVNYPVAFLCGDIMGNEDEEGEKDKKDRWRRIDMGSLTDPKTYEPPLEPGLYANQHGKKILVRGEIGW